MRALSGVRSAGSVGDYRPSYVQLCFVMQSGELVGIDRASTEVASLKAGRRNTTVTRQTLTVLCPALHSPHPVRYPHSNPNTLAISS